MAQRASASNQNASQSASGGAEKDSLSSVLSFNERSDLVNLVDSITTAIVNETAACFKPVPHGSDAENIDDEQSQGVSDADFGALERSTLRWYQKWKSLVIKRICEAANTRWEPIAKKQSVSEEKSWDELSWDDEPVAANARKAPPIDEELQALYPPVPTPLLEQDHDKRLLLLHSMLLLLLSLKHYYAPSRLLLLRLASSLNLSTEDVNKDEQKTAESLVSGVKALSANEEVEKKKQDSQSSRSWKVFGASVAGAAVIGLTGGLAAPLVAAGIGTVLGGLGLGATAAAGLLGSLAGSSVLVGGLFGAYGARMTGQMMETYAREISDFAFIPLRSHSKGEDVNEVEPEERRLRVTICVSGWLTEDADIVQPWRVLGRGSEVFALRWELETLKNLGSGIRDLVTSAAWNYARMEVLKLTVFSTLVGAVALPLGLLKLGKLVDNPFQIAKTRADKAGEVLADAIINRVQGERPVALVGYSLGARLIYSCLQHLANRQAFGLVDSVVLCGAPVPSSETSWRKMRAVVGGRLVNIYSENDYVLGFLYRAASAQAGIAGLRAVQVTGVENKDISNVVTSHFQYRHLLGRTMKELGWQDLDDAELRRESQALEQLQEQERKITEILRDDKTDGEEKRQLKESMQTQAPVQHEHEDQYHVERSAQDEKENPPSLPPRPISSSPTANKPNPAPQNKELPPRPEEASHSEEHRPIAKAEAGPKLQEKELPPPPRNDDDGGSLAPMRTYERTLHEDDEDELNEGFSGIKMVDND